MKLISFGFKHGQPTGDMKDILVLDIRKEPIPNPYYIPSLKHLKGSHHSVSRFLDQSPGTDSTVVKIRQAIVCSTAPVVYIGCTGGHHRSVYLVERLGKELGLEVSHRDIDKP